MELTLGGGVKTIQRGTITLGVGTASNTATISSVNTAKSSVNFLGYTMSTGDTANHYCASLVLTNSTTVTASRISTSGQVVVSYEVIEVN